MGGIVLAEAFTFSSTDFAAIGTTVASAAPVVVTVGAGVLALSVGIRFVFSKIRSVAK